MPVGDRTGPWGLGPMTGRGAGLCAGYPVPGYPNPSGGRDWYGVGRGGFPRGGGRGRAFGGGRSWWRRAGYSGYPAYVAAHTHCAPHSYGYLEPTAEQEKKSLQNEVATLEEELKAIRERIRELEQQEKKK